MRFGEFNAWSAFSILIKFDEIRRIQRVICFCRFSKILKWNHRFYLVTRSHVQCSCFQMTVSSFRKMFHNAVFSKKKKEKEFGEIQCKTWSCYCGGFKKGHLCRKWKRKLEMLRSILVNIYCKYKSEIWYVWWFGLHWLTGQSIVGGKERGRGERVCVCVWV